MANPACMNITRKPHTSVQTKLMATVLAPAAAFAALASESVASAAGAAGIPCPARTSGYIRTISNPRPNERADPCAIIPSPWKGETPTAVIDFVQKLHELARSWLLPD